MKRTLAAVALLMTALVWAQDTAVALSAPGTIPTDRPSENIALGATYTFEPGPNYGLCTDSGDAEQLTDGVYTDGYFWAQLVDGGVAGEDAIDPDAGPGCGATDTRGVVPHGGGFCGREVAADDPHPRGG